ncbi:hypothetical protein M1349_01725, partial [Patescibacteria group bacterium]|nr:hypothetical protein [Patescibacteria group bacterium]
KIIAWYDNEYGYANRLVEEVLMVGNKNKPQANIEPSIQSVESMPVIPNTEPAQVVDQPVPQNNDQTY